MKAETAFSEVMAWRDNLDDQGEMLGIDSHELVQAIVSEAQRFRVEGLPPIVPLAAFGWVSFLAGVLVGRDRALAEELTAWMQR